MFFLPKKNNKKISHSNPYLMKQIVQHHKKYFILQNYFDRNCLSSLYVIKFVSDLQQVSSFQRVLYQSSTLAVVRWPMTSEN
jgi:hypothetical protein